MPDLQANPAGTGTADIAAAKAFTGQFLRKTDEHLLASLLVARSSGTTGNARRDQGDNHGGAEAVKPNSGVPKKAKPENQQVCFEHRPHDSRPCSRPNCARQHLATSKPDQRTRFDAALKSFEDNKAAKDEREAAPPGHLGPKPPLQHHNWGGGPSNRRNAHSHRRRQPSYHHN